MVCLTLIHARVRWPGPVRRRPVLHDHALEAELRGGFDGGTDVVEDGSDLPVLAGRLAQLLEHLPPVLPGTVADGRPVDTEDVEGDEAHRVDPGEPSWFAADPALQAPEVRSAGTVRGDHLAVEHDSAAGEILGDAPQLREPARHARTRP